MQFTTLVLIRHAHSADSPWCSSGRLVGWYDAPLTRLGRAQVRLLRRRLAAERPAAATYTSPLVRARETAGAAPGHVRPAPVESLREICCGVLDGMPLAEVETHYPDLWSRNLSQTDEDFRWPGGESYRDFRHRVLRAVERIVWLHEGERVLVFTHAGVISQLLGALAGASPARWEAYRPGNASITELCWSAAGGTLTRFDDRRHLDPLRHAA